MNRLLTHYSTDVKHPEVSGAEHLEMLKIRDALVDLESTLTREERAQLTEADHALVQQSALFCDEIARFVDLAEHRQAHNIPPTRWWWYLDVVRYVPHSVTAPP